MLGTGAKHDPMNNVPTVGRVVSFPAPVRSVSILRETTDSVADVVEKQGGECVIIVPPSR